MTQLDVELALCKQSFVFFLCYCFEHIYKKKFNLYQFHKDLIDAVLHCTENNRMIINAPPRIGKTEILKHYMAWRFLLDPSSSMIYVSFDEKLVARKNREIKELLLWLSNHFNIPELKPLHQANGKTEWTNKANGTIIARGSNNALTGSGCSTLLVLDDPNKVSDRTSPTILSKRNAVFVNTIRNRINDANVPILVVQQRVAKDDMSGFLLEGGSGDNWVHYSFPAIKDNGEALCPERLPIEEIEKYKCDPFTYHAQYMQVPLDDIGNLFDRNHIVLESSRPPNHAMRLVISVDAALKGDIKSDYHAITVIGRMGPEYYILDIYNFHADITVLVDKVRQIRAKWGNDVPVLFEAKANGVGAAQILRKEMSGILEVSPCKDKVERALVVKYMFDSLNVHFVIRGLIWGEVQAQFTQFPHCKHDDIVDSVTQGITWLSKLPEQKRQPMTKQEAVNLGRPRFGRPMYASSGYNP